jgi:hypothetical protein
VTSRGATTTATRARKLIRGRVAVTIGVNY